MQDFARRRTDNLIGAGRGSRINCRGSRKLSRVRNNNKRKKEEFKIKSMDFSTAHQRAYIVVNLRTNSSHKVEIGKSPSCGCADFVKNSG